MKILKKGVTPDGIEIQIEDWSEDYSFFTYGSYLAAYPKKYIRIRSWFEFSNHQDAVNAFESLMTGEKNILDYEFVVMKSGGRLAPLRPILEKSKMEVNT